MNFIQMKFEENKTMPTLQIFDERGQFKDVSCENVPMQINDFVLLSADQYKKLLEDSLSARNVASGQFLPCV